MQCCPACGCNDVTPLRRATWWEAASVQLRCGHCGRSWWAPEQESEARGQRSEVRGQRSEARGQRSEVRGQRSEVRDQRSETNGHIDEAAVYPLLVCRECGERMKVSSTRETGIRHLKCDGCGRSVKARELRRAA